MTPRTGYSSLYRVVCGPTFTECYHSFERRPGCARGSPRYFNRPTTEGVASTVASKEFRVLFVCTANLCRSPMAQHLMRAGVARRWPSSPAAWAIESAGVHAEPGLPMHHQAAKVLQRRGVDTSAFRSQRINRDLIARADVVLTATREHRAAVVTLVPEAVRYTFTLGQFARMVSAATQTGGGDTDDFDDASSVGRSLLERATLVRSSLQPLASSREDVADPIGRRTAAFRRCADLLAGLTEAILPPLRANG